MNRPWLRYFLPISLLAVADLILFFQVGVLWMLPFTILTLLPGRLLLAIITTKRISRLSTWLYSYGLGIFILVLVGLVINTVGRLGHSGYALSQLNILAWLNALVIAQLIYLFLAGNKPSPKPLTKLLQIPAMRWADSIIFLQVIAALLCVLGGINLLDNNVSNWLVMLGLGVTGVIPITVILLFKKLSMWSVLSSLFGISITLLLYTSMRGNYLLGSDVLNEYGLSQIVAHQGFWSISQFSDTYNACLSITILPQVLRGITGENGLFIFRVVSQSLFSIAPILIFSTARNYLRPALAYLTSISFLIFINYNGSLPNHVRQEVALLFFTYAVMAVLSKEFGKSVQKLLIFLFSAGMIVSHYSTAYIAIIIFMVAAVINFVLHKATAKTLKQMEIPSALNLRMVGALLLLTVFWYSQIIQSSGGPVNYIQTTAKQLITGSSVNQHADQTSLSDQFNIFHKSAGPDNSFADYVKQNKLSTVDYQPRQVVSPETQPQLKPNALNTIIRFVSELIKKCYKFLAIGGMLFLLLAFWRRKAESYDLSYMGLLFGSLFVIGFSFVVPSFTVNYDQERLFQQLLVIVSISLVYFASRLLSPLRKQGVALLLAVFMGIYLLISTSFVGQLTGGQPLPLQLNNAGTDYDRYLVHKSEIMSVKWIASVHRYEVIYTDTYAANRFAFVDRDLEVRRTLNPNSFLPGSLIYYDMGNVVNGLTYATLNNGPLVYTAPTTYLEKNTNVVYSDGGSIIYEKPY